MTEEAAQSEVENVKTPGKKRFVFEVVVDDIPHTEDTVEYAFGEGAYFNDDFPIYTHALEILGQALHDAVVSNLRWQTHWEVEKSNSPEVATEKGERTKASCEHMIQYHKAKEQQAEGIKNSIKFVRMEEIEENSEKVVDSH